MKKHVLSSLILVAAFLLIGIFVLQIIWLRADASRLEADIQLQQRQFNENERRFNDRVTIALSSVAEQILDMYNDPSELFDAVHQVQSNYFVVRINDTLHPYLLETLLQREFKKNHIKEDFEYAIYDCFTDSLVYGRFVSFDTIQSNNIGQQPDIKWDKDAHYFSVYFPNRAGFVEPKTSGVPVAWYYAIIIFLLVFAFFSYTVWVVLKQKRLADIKNDFINNMTHELKTPISTISISSEVLLRENISSDPERIRQYARIIYTENKRLESQVERVLQLATLDKEKISLKKSQIDLHEIIRNCVDNFKIAVESGGGELILNLNSKHSTILGDKVHITNVIYNLVDNARKYSEKSPRITIETFDQPDEIVIRIKDNGIGMSKESLKNIFEKFYRVPTGNVHNVKGFGLGLYYVKLMTEQHGGRVEVKSELNSGSEFSIILPTK